MAWTPQIYYPQTLNNYGQIINIPIQSLPYGPGPLLPMPYFSVAAPIAQPAVPYPQPASISSQDQIAATALLSISTTVPATQVIQREQIPPSLDAFSDILIDETPVGKEKKQVRSGWLDPNWCCKQCKTKETPQRRAGPNSRNELCNACGLQYTRRLTKEKEIKSKMNIKNFIN